MSQPGLTFFGAEQLFLLRIGYVAQFQQDRRHDDLVQHHKACLSYAATPSGMVELCIFFKIGGQPDAFPQILLLHVAEQDVGFGRLGFGIGLQSLFLQKDRVFSFGDQEVFLRYVQSHYIAFFDSDLMIEV